MLAKIFTNQFSMAGVKQLNSFIRFGSTQLNYQNKIQTIVSNQIRNFKGGSNHEPRNLKIHVPKYKIHFEKDKKVKKDRNYSHQELDLAYKSGGDLGSLARTGKSKGAAKYKTVGDLWGHQGLSVYEDAFEGGMRDNFGTGVGRTCHLCNGEGCPGCSHTGVYS